MISIREFRGYRPGLHPYNQRQEYATQAGNLWLTSGEFRPLRNLLRTDYRVNMPDYEFDSIQVVRRNDGSYNYMHVDGYSVAESFYVDDERELVFANIDGQSARIIGLQGNYVDADTFGGTLISDYKLPIGMFIDTLAGSRTFLPPIGAKTDNTALLATYVTVEGFETAPTLATKVFSFDYSDTANVRIEIPPDVTNIETMRIYMEVDGEARLILEEPVNLTSVFQGGSVELALNNLTRLATRDFSLDPTRTTLALQTLEHDGPKDVKNLINASNGRLAGVSMNDRAVCMSSPGSPISWPVEIPIDRRVVRIIRSGEEVLVLTDGRPSVITGFDSPFEQQLSFAEPCVAAAGVVDMGFAILYPSYSGICAIQNYQGSVITMDNRFDGGSEIFNAEEWQKLPLHTLKAASYQGRYIFYYKTGGIWKGHALNVRYSEVIDLPDIEAEDIYLVNNPDTSASRELLEVFTLIGGELTKHEFNAAEHLTGWWEREFEIREHEPFVYVRVLAESYENCTLQVNDNDKIQITDGGIFTLDSTYRDRTATFRLESSNIVHSFVISHRAEDVQ